MTFERARNIARTKAADNALTLWFITICFIITWVVIIASAIWVKGV